MKNQECKTRQHSCYVDVMKLTTGSYNGKIIYERIGTWNGDTFQPCLSEDVFNDAMLNPRVKTVFRVPIVKYFPFVVKHELSTFFGECPLYSLPCYGQRRKTDNTTVSMKPQAKLKLIRFLQASFDCSFPTKLFVIFVFIGNKLR